jgi:hypothetical protein
VIMLLTLLFMYKIYDSIQNEVLLKNCIHCMLKLII